MQTQLQVCWIKPNIHANAHVHFEKFAGWDVSLLAGTRPVGIPLGKKLAGLGFSCWREIQGFGFLLQCSGFPLENIWCLGFLLLINLKRNTHLHVCFKLDKSQHTCKHTCTFFSIREFERKFHKHTIN